MIKTLVINLGRGKIMKVAVIALTEDGVKIGEKLKQQLAESELASKEFSSLNRLVGPLFEDYDGLVFIMSLETVVRVIAPYIKDKRNDPAVVTVDETAKQAISTLSGHLGGANALAREVAEIIGAEPIITNASNCKKKLSFDLLAQRLNSVLTPFKNLKLANAALVNNKPVNIFSDLELDFKLPEAVKLFPLEKLTAGELRVGFPVIISKQKINLKQPYLQLVPQNIIVGIGCRRGVPVDLISAALNSALGRLNFRLESIKALATVDLKEDEVGIRQLAQRLEVPVEIVSRAEIKTVEFDHSSSEFEKEKIGAGGVCELVAMISAQNPELKLKKQILDGVTIAVVEDNSL